MIGNGTIAEIKGLDELLAQLEQLPERVERKVLSHALRAGARVYVRRIKANVDGMLMSAAGKKTLKRALIIKPFKARRGKGPGVGIRIKKPDRLSEKKSDAWYYHLFEFGTAPRFRKVAWHFDMASSTVDRGEVWDERGRKSRRSTSYRTSRIKTVVDRRAYTGQIKPQPFIRPAVKQGANEAANAVVQAARAKMHEALKA